MHCKWKYFYLDIGVWGSAQVQRWQFCALDCSHVQRLGIEIVLQLQTTSQVDFTFPFSDQRWLWKSLCSHNPRLALKTSRPQDWWLVSKVTNHTSAFITLLYLVTVQHNQGSMPSCFPTGVNSRKRSASNIIAKEGRIYKYQLRFLYLANH